MSVLVLMEQSEVSMQTLTPARQFGDALHAVRMDAVQPFAPDAMAAILARVADDLDASAVFAAGTDRTVHGWTECGRIVSTYNGQCSQFSVSNRE